MANILEKYGIKEVADVMFYKIDSNGNPSVPVLYLDTLKVSTIDQTASEATANGGKGNAPLITWDYGKEINVTLQDALFSAKSMAIMFGNGDPVSNASGSILHTIAWSGTAVPTQFEGPNGKKYNVPSSGATTYDATGSSTTTYVAGKTYYTTFNLTAACDVIEISPNTFPGTYYVTGDTYARSETTGLDEFFQFVIPKAKVQSNNTITLEAAGDPSVFNLNLKVLRPSSGSMMKLIKYSLSA